MPDADSDPPEADADTDADADSDTDSDADADTDADSDADADTDADTDVDCSKLVWFDGTMRFEGFAEADMQAFCHAGYNTITGSLSVSNADTIEPLTCVCEVTENVSLGGVFTSDDGLRNLRRVGGWMSVSSSGLTDIDGFDHLEEVGDQLWFAGSVLTDVSGFASLTKLGTELAFPVSHHAPLLEDVSGLNALTNHQGIQIEDTALRQLTGLNALGNFPSMRQLAIRDNAHLMAVTGLASSYAVPYVVDIDGNSALGDISGLHGITSIGTLYLRDNPRLSSDNVQAFLEAVGESNISASVIDGNGN